MGKPHPPLVRSEMTNDPTHNAGFEIMLRDDMCTGSVYDSGQNNGGRG
jgi:hypothetical protein